MTTLRFFLFLLTLASVAVASADVTDIGSRRELFVDHALIEGMEGVELRLQEPRRESPALYFDRPYEGKFSAYATIIQDGDLWRMYYRGLPSAGKERVARICYAESHDGIVWTKPDLGLCEYEGSTANNIVYDEDVHLAHNFSPFVDTRPGVPADERFKAIAGVEEKGIAVFASTDGLHWRRWGPEYVFSDGMFDSHNIVFWSEHEQAYVCYFRTWTGEGFEGWRTVSRTTSPDLINWTEGVRMDFGDTPMEHIYTNGTQPYYRAPHIYVGLAKRFLPEKRALDPVVEQSLLRDPKRGGDISDSVLLTTRGGNRYDRTFMEAFVRPGPSAADWAARDNTPGLGFIPAADGRRMYFYRLSHYAQTDAHLSRYSLRLDGFVSVHAPYAGGELLTKPIRFTGDTLELNYQSSAAGEVRVEIQDLNGQPLPGFELENCLLICGDEIARSVRWEGDPDLSALAGQPVRLRFALTDADLFSYRFK